MGNTQKTSEQTLQDRITERARWYLAGNYEGGQETNARWSERARELIADPPKNEVWTPEESTRFTLEDEIKEAFECIGADCGDAMGIGFASDLLTLAIANVDFRLLADELIEASKEMGK